jgi:hypothetical protein
MRKGMWGEEYILLSSHGSAQSTLFVLLPPPAAAAVAINSAPENLPNNNNNNNNNQSRPQEVETTTTTTTKAVNVTIKPIIVKFEFEIDPSKGVLQRYNQFGSPSGRNRRATSGSPPNFRSICQRKTEKTIWGRTNQQMVRRTD